MVKQRVQNCNGHSTVAGQGFPPTGKFSHHLSYSFVYSFSNEMHNINWCLPNANFIFICSNLAIIIDGLFGIVRKSDS